MIIDEFKSLTNYGFPYYSINLKGELYSAWTNTILTPDENGHYYLRGLDRTELVCPYKLVAEAWWMEDPKLWRGSKYTNEIAFLQQFHFIPPNQKCRLGAWPTAGCCPNTYLDIFGNIWDLDSLDFITRSIGEDIQLDRMVATLFVPVPKQYMDFNNPYQHLTVKHKDGNPKNCSACNLEWTDETDPFANDPERRSLTPNKQYKVWFLLEQGYHDKRITELVGINQGYVSNIRHKRQENYETPYYSWRESTAGLDKVETDIMKRNHAIYMEHEIGKSNEDIAEKLKIPLHTINSVLAPYLEKRGVDIEK